jgi:hypothetical protein
VGIVYKININNDTKKPITTVRWAAMVRKAKIGKKGTV